MGIASFKRLLIKFPWNALSFGIRKAILASFGSVETIKEMSQFFVNIPVHILTLTLAGTRHSAIFHGTGGWLFGTTPPRVWLLSELELRLKNQRAACHEMKSLSHPSLWS